MKVNPYETLGISKEASPEDIKKAYRSRASKTHPDKEGGSHEDFLAVQESYEILSDPERKERYDSTGETKPEEGASALSIILEIFSQVAETLDPVHQDLVHEVRTFLKTKRKGVRSEVRNLRKQAKRWRIIGRKIKAPGHNPVKSMCRSQRASILQNYVQQRGIRKMIDTCLEMMRDWSYDFEPGVAQVNKSASLDDYLRAALMGNMRRG